jgi:hypothetical protein
MGPDADTPTELRVAIRQSGESRPIPVSGTSAEPERPHNQAANCAQVLELRRCGTTDLALKRTYEIG